MKAILVIDTPMFNIYPLDDVRVIYTIQIKDSEFNFAHGIGNLKPMPNKIDLGYPCEKYDEGYSDGWDDCIDEILGEKDEKHD